MKDIKLIAFDVDGTLLTDDKKFTSETGDVLNKLHDKGILLGISSGRHSKNIISFCKNWNLNFDFDFFICTNGFELIDNLDNTKEEYYPLESSTLLEIINKMEPYLGKGAVRTNERIYNPYKIPVPNYDYLIEVDDLKELAKEKSGKIQYVYYDDEFTFKAQEYFNNNPSDLYWGIRAEKGRFEFCDKRVNKAKTLMHFLDKHNINYDNVLTCGDSDNDIELLSSFKNSVCLKNGTDLAKNVAKDITKDINNNSGLAKYLKEELL